MASKTIHLLIHGRVQGVFYRASMSEVAQRHQVNGWVRNRRNGSVEAMLQGEENQVDAVIEWARIGPASACVERIDIQEGAGEFLGFHAKETI